MSVKIVLSVLIGIAVLGFIGFDDVFAETLIVASAENDPSHFSKVSITTGNDIHFLGNSGIEFSAIDFSPDGKLYAATSGDNGSPGIYDLSVTIDSGNSDTIPANLVPGYDCSDISFSSTGLLYCFTNRSSVPSQSLISISLPSDSAPVVITPIGSPNLAGYNTGNAIAVNSMGLIYHGNDDGLYTLNSITGSATLVAVWDLSETRDNLGNNLRSCQSTAMEFNSSDILYASLKCSGSKAYLVTVDTTDAKVSLIGSLSSTNPVYNVAPSFNTPFGDMKTSALAFAPFDFDFIIGSTYGTVDNVENVNVEAEGDGASISSTLNPVTVDLCDNSSLVMGIGTEINAECGSVTIQVVSGTVEAEFQAKGGSIATTTLIEGDDVFFDEEVFSITNNGRYTVQVIVNGEDPPRDILPGQTISLGEPAQPPTDPTSIEHYLSYKAKQPKDDDKFVKFTVELSDTFETDPTTYTVEKPDRLYNPVQKTHDGVTTDIVDEISHYVGYKIKEPKGTEKFEHIKGVSVTDQFGELTIDIKKPKLLLVPSFKDHDIIPEFTSPFTVNHFKCYDAKETKHTPKFEKRTVDLLDQFAVEPFTMDVKKPKMFCVPVYKTHEGVTSEINGEENNLTCYDVKKMKGEPKFEKRNVFTNNQFGPEELKVEKQEELCVPSKILP